MSEPHYERLSAVDAALLRFEENHAHMHVGAVAIFDAGPLRNAAGALDMEQLQRALESTLHHTPRLRQRIRFVPMLDHPVWVDDDRFNLHYHLRHTALPPPGDERQLKRLTGRIVSQQLDRGKPLWEAWFVEGLADDRFAMIVKAHHCMVDGIAGIGALAAMMRADEQRTVEAAPAWEPRPQPDGAALLRGELGHRASAPAALLESGRRALWSPGRALSAWRESAASLGEMLGAEVYNYGLSGSGTDQHLLIFEEFARDVEAELIVLGLTVHNVERVKAAYRPTIDRITQRRLLMPTRGRL